MKWKGHIIPKCTAFACEGEDGEVRFVSSGVQAASVGSTNGQRVGELSRPVQPKKQQRCYAVSCQDTQRTAPAQQHLFIYFRGAQDRTAAVKAKQSLSLPMDQISTALPRPRLNTEPRQRNQQQLHSKTRLQPPLLLICGPCFGVRPETAHNPAGKSTSGAAPHPHSTQPRQGRDPGQGWGGGTGVMLLGTTELPINTEPLNTTSEQTYNPAKFVRNKL